MADDDDDLQVNRQRVTLRLRVEDKLRAAIASGRFAPGQRLIERELCTLLGVGRTSIREALRQLDAEGLVSTVPHRGPVVSTISPEEAEHLYAVRALLEAYAGRKFAERRRPEDVAAMTAAVARLEKAAAEGDLRSLIEANNQFYRALTDGCGNPVLGQMLSTLHGRMSLQRISSMRQPGRSMASVAELREILEAITAGDTEAAEVACRRHVQAAARAALAVLSANAASEPAVEAKATKRARA
jgi:DNA-binding GntR family transcriptional regulator